MLSYLPIIGSILLTIVIAWTVILTIIGQRRFRHEGDAMQARYIARRKQGGLRAKSICCRASTTPLGWTQDGWVARCNNCGEFQYLGDDFDNPPPGFYLRDDAINSKPYAEIKVDDRMTPKLREAQSRITDIDPKHFFAAIGRPEVTSEPTQADRADDAREAARISHHFGDEGEPLPPAMTHQPNIGGEGNPDYAGPHYDVATPRFAPYEMLGDPIPGTAVHKTGETAIVGPIKDKCDD